MNRKIDDIIPPDDMDRRSIRKVSVGRTLKRNRSEKTKEKVRDIHGQSTNSKFPPEPPHVRRSSSRFGIWVVAFILLAGLIFGFSLIFSGAKLVITPKQRTVLVDAEFNTYKNPKESELGYEVMTVEKEGSKKVVASGKEFVEEKASGSITIYNDFNSIDQRLRKNTRFESPDGLIYRINKSVVVPGQKKEDGKTVPGSIEVTVYADEEGDKYNIGLVDFTIPGFAGDPRFDDFYARSKTEMTGGFSGERKVVSEADETNARIEIQADLKTQLLEQISSQKPEGFEIYEDGIFIEFTSLSNEENGDRVMIREKAVLYGVIFGQKEFAQFITSSTVAGFDEEDVEILDTSSLSFTVLNKEEIQPWNDEEFSFKLSGKAHIIWSFESEQLKDDLVGKSKEALETVLTGYPSISEAQIILRPFWRQTFPKDTEDIKITTIIEK